MQFLTILPDFVRPITPKFSLTLKEDSRIKLTIQANIMVSQDGWLWPISLDGHMDISIGGLNIIGLKNNIIVRPVMVPYNYNLFITL